MTLENIQKIFDATGLSVKVEILDKSYLPDDCNEGYQIEGIYLTKEKRERSNILETYEIDAWVVGHDVCTPGGHWEPDDYDYNEVGDFQNLHDAVREICNLIIYQNLQGCSENEWAKEYANVQVDEEMA